MRLRALLLLSMMLVFAACSTDVKPWEKETLGKETMSEGGTNLLLKQYEEHIYFSKESTKGGGGVAGGGCGCN